jgi:hypothetical protein
MGRSKRLAIFGLPVGLDFKFHGFLGLFGDRHGWVSFYLEYWDVAIMGGVFLIS